MLLLWLHGRNEQAASPDESYLWYGTQEVLRHNVPLRDFRSYEPGRYWFSAPFLRFKPGIRSIRFAATTFLGLGIATFGLTMLSNGHSLAATLLIVPWIAIWSIRPSKRFDQGEMLMVASAAIWVLTDPTPSLSFFAGIIVGVGATVGLNHGLYGAVAVGSCSLLAATQATVDLLPNALFLGLGVLVAMLPFIGTMMLVRGFTANLIQQRVRDPLKRGATNLPLRYPRPFATKRHPPSAQFPPATTRLVSFAFTALPAGALLVLVWAVIDTASFTAEHAVLTGSSLSCLVFWHHAASRADIPHLSTVMPIFLGLAAATLDLRWWLCVAVVFAFTAGSLRVAPSFHDRECRRRQPELFVKPDLVITDGLWFNIAYLPLLSLASDLHHRSPHDGTWLAVPTTLWLLPLVNRRSAVFNTFCVYPADTQSQAVMIGEIDQNKPEAAFVSTAPLDRSDDLRFTATHPDVWNYLQQNYEFIDSPMPPDYYAFKRRHQ